MDELERCHQEQQTGMQGELKKEIALLQKKVLMESVSQRSGGKVASFPVSLVQFSCRLQYVFDTVSSLKTGELCHQACNCKQYIRSRKTGNKAREKEGTDDIIFSVTRHRNCHSSLMLML